MILMPILIGSIAGIIYGCSFVLQQRSILSSEYRSGFEQLKIIFFIGLRFGVLGATVWYLLRTPQIRSILIIIPFILGFWLVILLAKVVQHERYRTDNR